MKSLALVLLLAGCSNVDAPPQFPANPPPNPSGEPPNEAVGPEAAGAPMGPTAPESTPSAPDPGPTVVGNAPAKPPEPPIVTDSMPIDPTKPMPADTLGTNATLVVDQPSSVMVDGRADILSAAQTAADKTRGGVMPTQLALATSGGVVRVRGVSGKTTCGGKTAPAGPDDAGCSRLIGVFVGVKTAKLRHGSDELGTTPTLHPRLGETFVVGDGLTGTGTGDIQTIAIPKGATKLYLGYAGDTYGNNAGGVSAIVTQHAK
ncbi:MAG TPA: hypothetical protein VGG28_33460 [Kofleriaceae bacterium]|jgi:hypothetical protein